MANISCSSTNTIVEKTVEQLVEIKMTKMKAYCVSVCLVDVGGCNQTLQLLKTATVGQPSLKPVEEKNQQFKKQLCFET